MVEFYRQTKLTQFWVVRGCDCKNGWWGSLLSSSKEYGLFALETICAIVRINLRETVFHMNRESNPRRAEGGMTMEGIETWEVD